MPKPTNLPGKHNPLKTDYYNNARIADPEMDASHATFWERTKTTNPALYQDYAKQKAQSEARRIAFEASLDDPDTIALYEHLTERWVANRLGALSDELAVLGLEANATKREVRNAYRRKARKLHPDAGGDEAAFKQLHEAYRRVLAAAKA